MGRRKKEVKNRYVLRKMKKKKWRRDSVKCLRDNEAKIERNKGKAPVHDIIIILEWISMHEGIIGLIFITPFLFQSSYIGFHTVNT